MSWTTEDVAAHYERHKQPQGGATPAPSPDPDLRCRWCGGTYDMHLDSRPPDAPVPRTPCIGLKSGFQTLQAKKPPDRLEAPIQAECLKFLEEDGWRILITNPVSDRSKGKGFGEVGMADAMAIRYLSSIQLGSGAEVFVHRGTCEILWLEFKRGKGGILSSKQREWHTKERARGALTIIAGEDFPPSVEGFRAWYKASGLARRRGM